LPPTKGPTTYQRSVFKDPRDDELSSRTQVKIDEDAARAPEVPAIALRTTIDECLPLVKQMAKKLDGKQRDARSWPHCEGARFMQISVSQKNALRALVVLNQLLETLLAVGYPVSSGGKDNAPAYATILAGKLKFRLKERGRQESIPLSREQQGETDTAKAPFFTRRTNSKYRVSDLGAGTLRQPLQTREVSPRDKNPGIR